MWYEFILPKEKAEEFRIKYKNNYSKIWHEHCSECWATISLKSKICYYDEDNYYCGLSEKYTYTIGAEPHTYRTIKSAYKKGDEIVIYDYFLRTINDDCFTSYMKDEKNETCGKALENKKEVDYKFLKKYGTRYVHIFKKSGDSYYWVSSKNLDK